MTRTKNKQFRIYDGYGGEMILNNKGYTCYLNGMTTYGEFESDGDAFELARHYIMEIRPLNINGILNFLDELEKEC